MSAQPALRCSGSRFVGSRRRVGLAFRPGKSPSQRLQLRHTFFAGTVNGTQQRRADRVHGGDQQHQGGQDLVHRPLRCVEQSDADQQEQHAQDHKHDLHDMPSQLKGMERSRTAA